MDGSLKKIMGYCPETGEHYPIRINADGEIVSALSENAVDKRDFNTKGDILVATANDAYTVLPAGDDNQILTVDSGETVGLKYADPAAGVTFGSGVAFPGAPATGDFYKRTDLGNSIFQYDGANWSLIHSGIKARAYMSADQDNIAANTWTKVTLNAESYDIGAGFDTANNCFVVPITGYYLITGTVVFEITDLTTGEEHTCAIYVDPLGVGGPVVVQYGTNFSYPAGAVNYGVIASSILYLTATDKVYLYARSGEADNDIESGEANTSLSIHLLSV